MRNKLKVINLFGGPGCGKSTCAHGLMHIMKGIGIDVEYAPEVAKDLVFDNDMETLKNQREIFRRQLKRIRRYEGKVEWVVTDSPIPMSCVYKNMYLHPQRKKDDKPPEMLGPEFDKEVFEAYYRFSNENFFLNRTIPYRKIGRIQNRAEADVIAEKILEFMRYSPIVFRKIDGDKQAPYTILTEIGINWDEELIEQEDGQQ